MLEDNGVLTEAEQSLKCQYQKGQNQAATVVSGRAFQLFGQSAIIEQEEPRAVLTPGSFH